MARSPAPTFRRLGAPVVLSRSSSLGFSITALDSIPFLFHSCAGFHPLSLPFLCILPRDYQICASGHGRMGEAISCLQLPN